MGPTDAVPLSGRQYEIRHGAQHAVVAEVGAALRKYTVDGVQVVDGFDIGEMATAARGCPLIPWPNRLHEGRYTWDGVDYQVPIDEPDKNNALHGFTRFANWTATAHDDAVTMALRLHAQPGYPFVLELAVRYALDDTGLTVTTTARNVGGGACPFALGAHPYFTVGTRSIDDALLQLPAETYLPTDAAQIPTGRQHVAGTPYDFRCRRRLGDVQIDYAFTNLTRDSNGCAWLTLAHPDSQRLVKVWVDDQFPYIEVFTGDTVPEEHRRRQGLGVEPMTCPPNAFQTGEHVRRLEPGEQFVASWGVVAQPGVSSREVEDRLDVGAVPDVGVSPLPQ